MTNESDRRRIRRGGQRSIGRKRRDFEAVPGEAEANAVHDAFLKGAGPQVEDVAATLSDADGATRAAVVGRLQRERGNAYVQRVVQRQEQPAQGARPAFNPLDPTVLAAAARQVIAENEAPVRRWLNANTSRLRLMTLGEIVGLARREVPQAGRLADVEIEGLAREWAARGGFTIPPGPVLPAARPGPSLEIPDAVRRAFSIATEGVNVVNLPNGRMNVSVSGLTAQLAGTTLSVGWSGSLGIEIPMQGFVLAGRLSRERWELTLSTPGESTVPDLSQLGDVFRKAETAMRRMIVAISELPSLDDVEAVQAAISPHIKPVKEAVGALQAIAGAPRVSVGITAGGPVAEGERPPAMAAQAPEGVSIAATLMIRF